MTLFQSKVHSKLAYTAALVASLTNNVSQYFHVFINSRNFHLPQLHFLIHRGFFAQISQKNSAFFFWSWQVKNTSSHNNYLKICYNPSTKAVGGKQDEIWQGRSSELCSQTSFWFLQFALLAYWKCHAIPWGNLKKTQSYALVLVLTLEAVPCSYILIN